ncbi:unnamed protein product [Rotaria sp. Silwood2]|nr:unnamed protein product [Rotaria sp. Silwood2]
MEKSKPQIHFLLDSFRSEWWLDKKQWSVEYNYDQSALIFASKCFNNNHRYSFSLMQNPKMFYSNIKYLSIDLLKYKKLEKTLISQSVTRPCFSYITRLSLHGYLTIDVCDKIRHHIDARMIVYFGFSSIVGVTEAFVRLIENMTNLYCIHIQYAYSLNLFKQLYTAFAISGSKLTKRIRSKAFACLLRQEVAYFDRPENSSSAICVRLSSDASSVQEMTGTRLGAICEVVAMSIFGILFGCFLNWQLTLIVFLPVVIICITSCGDVVLRIRTNQQFNRISKRASTLAIEVIYNIRTIKQLSIEKEVLRQYSELIHEVFISQRIAASFSAAETFFDLFDRTPAIDNTSTEGQELIDFRGEIKFDLVKFIYPTRPTSIILRRLQLHIKPSQRVAFVGASGCGKSTIIQLLERFYDVTSGRLLIDGVDIRKLNLQWVRSRFGLVSQEPILFDLTIAENIAYGLENVPMDDIINAASKANIHQFIEQLPQGYETKVGSKGSFLSGGQKQRIAIARVLLRRPKVLLLDEATSAMDSYNEQIVQEALDEAQTEDSSRTSIIIAHRLSTIRSCDLICVFDKGQIVESGTHTELIQQRGTYYKMLAQNNLH